MNQTILHYKRTHTTMYQTNESVEDQRALEEVLYHHVPPNQIASEEVSDVHQHGNKTKFKVEIRKVTDIIVQPSSFLLFSSRQFPMKTSLVRLKRMMMMFIWSALDSCVWKCKWQKKIPRSRLPSGMWTRRFKMQWSGPWW